MKAYDVLFAERDGFMINNKTVGKIEYMWALALIAFFAININVYWRQGYLAWYGCLALVFVCYFVVFGGRFVIKDLSFAGWLSSFILLGVISIAWCLSAPMVMDVVKTLIIYLAVFLLMQFSLNSGFDVEHMLKGYFLATLINAVYIVLTIDLVQLGEEQLGSNILEGWNGNGIGFMTAQGVLIGCYLVEKNKRKIAKAFLVLCVIALSVLTIYTGSRTAFLMLVAELILYFCLRNPSKMVRNILISLGILVVAFYLVMTVESFYNVLGIRLEGLFALFGGEGEVDSSSDIRNLFIENGKRWFLEQPAFGYGLNNYKVLNGAATGRATYAHNTFIELAVDLGVVGLVWYYSVYVYLMYHLFKDVKGRPINAFLLSALVASLMSHYGTVAYYGFYQNFLLFLCFFAIHKARKKRIEAQL